MASGLSSSTAMVQRAAPQAASMTCAPSTTSIARWRISASSQQIHGSHSAPFSTSQSAPADRASASLAAVGKAAPPSPAIPAAPMRSSSVSAVSERQSQGPSPGSRSSRSSPSMTMQSPTPPGTGSLASSRTAPDTGECSSAATPPPAAIRVPTRTVSPGRTSGVAASPDPWSSASIATAGAGSTRNGCSNGRVLQASSRSPPRMTAGRLMRPPWPQGPQAQLLRAEAS